MKTVVFRVSEAEVRVDGRVRTSISAGLLLLVGVEKGDTEADADETARKVLALRMFPGRTPMDVTVKDARGACLVVSQFTLAASIRKGNRPSFDRAEVPPRAEALYLRVADGLVEGGVPTETGAFGEHMDVQFVGDGPVTFVVATRGGKIVE
jgi:D-tyrosyl-tRNA(Tyr) deacylase